MAKKRSPVFYGRSLRMLMARPKDVRLMTVYGYARLMRYDENFNIVPYNLERLEVENSRIFTLHLRQRHRWPNGQPFTSEEFRFTGETSLTIPDYLRLARRRFSVSVTSCQISRSSTTRRFASLGPTRSGISRNRSRVAGRFTFTGHRIICGSSVLDTTTKRP